MLGERDQSDRQRPGGSGGGSPGLHVPDGSDQPDEHAHEHHRPHAHLPHLPHPQLIEPEEDRWKWRAHIRRDPRKLFFYRIGVGVAGLLLMIAAALSGPLPGPGGIPLFLLGLAVWSSEFEWANNMMGRFKRLFDRYRGWPRRGRIAFWFIVVACAWAFFYLGMLMYGIPPWLPEMAKEWLRYVPGLR